MNTRILSTLLLLIASVHVYAREHMSLNGTWQFALAETEQAANRLADFHSPKFNSNAFKPVPVPSNWAVLGYEEPVYRGFKDDKASEGFYLHEFTTPEDWTAKRVLLHFGGVWSSAEVWLNEHYLGRHDNGFASFAFDVTDKLNAGSPNRLAVRVRQVSRDYKFDVYDDWTLGGIYRDVSLEAMPKKRWLDQLTVQTVFDNQYQDADLKIRVMVGDTHKTTLPGNYPSPSEPYGLRFTLFTKEGNEVAQQQMTLPAHTATSRETNLTLRIQSPHQWTAETPYLYNLRVELLEKDNVTHTRTERIGFRQVSTEGGIFRINGQAVKLRGVNRHDEHPDVGRTTTHEHWLQDITLMKAANINYIRMAHYTHAKGFIELCDELGMYVGNEISLGGAGHRMYDPSYVAAVLQRSYETVSRDINSPSIIYWSIGNEDPLTSLHLASVKLTKALDPTRPVLIPWRSEEWLPEEIDMLSSHYWKPHEYDQLAGQATRPVITTEYTHAFGVDGLGGLEARWKALTKHPAGAGGAIWMWADQGIRTPVAKPEGSADDLGQGDEYLRIDYAGWDGIVDSYRNPTRDYLETKAVYAQVYPATDKISFIPGQASVRIPIQNDFDFTDLHSIRITWSVWEDDRELASGTGSAEGPPHTTSVFELPMEKLNDIHAGKTYYARFIFTHTNGTEINRKAVELEPFMKPAQSISPTLKLSVIKGEAVIVEAGEARYIFNPASGHLTSAEIQGKSLITGLQPIIWRPLDPCETSIIGSKRVHELVNLNQYTPSITEWNVEDGGDRVIIHAKVKYTVDDKNHFTTIYRYAVQPDGQLNVRYEILPDVEAPWLPIVGMSLQSVPELSNVRWLGLGPHDAYPNKQSAPILGVWGGIAGSKEVVGNKSTRWIERNGTTGKIYISNNGYMLHQATSPKTIHILSSVLGRPEKGRKADESVPQLQTDTGEPFIGEFSVRLKTNP